MSEVKPRFFDLCLAEPFRIFFPLATLLGLSGVSLWPLFFLGLHKFYPGPMHARLMIEGFLAGFIIGFLGTALPRLLSAPPLRRWELRALLALYLLTAGLHIAEQPRAGDASFIAFLLCFGACMMTRARLRGDLLPPGFVLVAYGILSGLAGPALWLCGLRGWVSGGVTLFGAMLLNQAFALFPLLGVGAFLLPRFLDRRNPRAITEERSGSDGWEIRAAFSALTGATLLTSYWNEACHPAAPGAIWLRALATIFYLIATVPFHRQPWPPRTAQVAAQLALLALIAGLIFPLLWPAQRLAGLHVIFLGGFSLITFTIATRVVLGHSGNEALFESRLPSLQAATLLILVGAVLRAAGDFSPERPHWLTHASYLWMAAAAIWSFCILPKVRISDHQA